MFGEDLFFMTARNRICSKADAGNSAEKVKKPRNIRIIQESTKWLTFYNKRTGIFGDIKSFVGLFLYKCPKVAVSVNDVSILVAMTG